MFETNRYFNSNIRGFNAKNLCKLSLCLGIFVLAMVKINILSNITLDNKSNESGLNNKDKKIESETRKINLSVYYETNCGDSQVFIQDQLTSAITVYKLDLLNIRLIPFGKGSVSFPLLG
jgi:hypothetical protein